MKPGSVGRSLGSTCCPRISPVHRPIRPNWRLQLAPMLGVRLVLSECGRSLRGGEHNRSVAVKGGVHA